MPSGGFIGLAPTTRTANDWNANSIFLTPLVAQQNGTATAVLLDCFAATATTTIKVLIYDGSHSALLASSGVYTSSVAGYNRFALTVPLSLTVGTTYYVGYVCSTSFTVTIYSGPTSWWVNGGQSVTTPANPLAAGATSTSSLMIAVELDGTGSSGKGFGLDQGSGVTLSAANATATCPATANLGARSLVTHATGAGKWYAEILVGGTINGTVGIGLATVDWGTAQGAGNTLQYAWWALANGNTNTPGGTWFGSAFAAGDVIGIAYDAVANLLWWNKNNGTWFSNTSSSGNPATGSNGSALGTVLWPWAIGVATGATGTAAVFTLRDTAAAQAYAPPSGFTAWAVGVAAPTTRQYAVSLA